jgi:hypothetical protein
LPESRFPFFGNRLSGKLLYGKGLGLHPKKDRLALLIKMWKKL